VSNHGERSVGMEGLLDLAVVETPRNLSESLSPLPNRQALTPQHRRLGAQREARPATGGVGIASLSYVYGQRKGEQEARRRRKYVLRGFSVSNRTCFRTV